VDGVLLFDKPGGVSSNTALQTVKRIYQASKAGHTGSLDPIATGLLPICFGQATKLSGFLLDGDKRYRVRARLGIRTSTADTEGEATAQSDPSGVKRQDIECILPVFLGAHKQVPPMYSALKHQGQRLYQLARAGQEVDRPARDIFLHDLQLLAFGEDVFEMEVTCSKGTYVRTLVEDVAAALGQYAHVIELRRLGAAPFLAPQMVTLEQVQVAEQTGLDALDALLLPPAAAVEGMPQLTVDENCAFFLAHGQAVRSGALPPDQAIAVLGPGGDLLGIGRRNADGLLAPNRWFS
jgi:tRNA pseudouridine55 synthase